MRPICSPPISCVCWRPPGLAYGSYPSADLWVHYFKEYIENCLVPSSVLLKPDLSIFERCLHGNVLSVSGPLFWWLSPQGARVDAHHSLRSGLSWFQSYVRQSVSIRFQTFSRSWFQSNWKICFWRTENVHYQIVNNLHQTKIRFFIKLLIYALKSMNLRIKFKVS